MHDLWDLTDAASPRTGACDRCGASVPCADLRHAAMPPLVAIAAAGNSDMDEPEPVPLAAFLDHRRYCPDCRRRINLQRAVVSTLVIGALAATVYLIVR
jgi:hypothetical protein